MFQVYRVLHIGVRQSLDSPVEERLVLEGVRVRDIIPDTHPSPKVAVTKYTQQQVREGEYPRGGKDVEDFDTLREEGPLLDTYSLQEGSAVGRHYVLIFPDGSRRDIVERLYPHSAQALFQRMQDLWTPPSDNFQLGEDQVVFMVSPKYPILNDYYRRWGREPWTLPADLDVEDEHGHLTTPEGGTMIWTGLPWWVMGV